MGGVAATIAVSALLGGYQVYSSEKAREDARKESKRQRTEFELEEKKLGEQIKNEQALEVSKVKRAKSRSLSNDYLNKGGTVLTGPLGVAQPLQTANKTILGA